MAETAADTSRLILNDTDARILVIESDPDDLSLISGLLGQSPISLSLFSASTIAEALDYLEAATVPGGAGLPDLVILDMDLPEMGAPRLLTKLRRHPVYKSLPVVVLTRQSDPAVVRRAYDFGANAVVSKSSSAEGMAEIVRTIVDFWFKIADRYLLD